MPPLKINPEYKSLIPPLSEEEYSQLEENILAYGCRDTIKAWKNTIVDGHNRYEICQKHSIPYQVSEIRFQSKDAATLWIIENQLGRRNLAKATRISLAMQKADLLREKARQNRSKTGCKPLHIRKEIAKEAGVSEQTVYKYMKIKEIGDQELKQQVDSGKVTIGAAHRKLDITTKVVTVLYENKSVHDINKPHTLKLAQENIRRIGNLYQFISDKSMLLCNADEISAIIRRLKAHRKRVRALMSQTSESPANNQAQNCDT